MIIILITITISQLSHVSDRYARNMNVTRRNTGGLRPGLQCRGTPILRWMDRTQTWHHGTPIHQWTARNMKQQNVLHILHGLADPALQRTYRVGLNRV